MSITVKLTKPIEHGDKIYTELTFREAEFGDYIAADAMPGDAGKTAAVLAGMSDTSLPVIRKLSMRDANAIMDATAELMGNAPSE